MTTTGHTRTVKVYHLAARDAAFWDVEWDYEYPGSKGAGWYWDSFVDGKPCMEFQGPYSSEKIARFAAGA